MPGKQECAEAAFPGTSALIRVRLFPLAEDPRQGLSWFLVFGFDSDFAFGLGFTNGQKPIANSLFTTQKLRVPRG